MPMLALAALIAAVGGAIWWGVKHPSKYIGGGGGPTPPTVTNTLVQGRPYGLSVFAASGLDPVTLWTIMSAPAANLPIVGMGRAPTLITQGVAGTGYTFAPVIDEWIVYAAATGPRTLPAMFGKGGTDVTGVIAKAVDITSSTQAPTPTPATKVSGYWPGMPGSRPRPRVGAMPGQHPRQHPRGRGRAMG